MKEQSLSLASRTAALKNLSLSFQRDSGDDLSPSLLIALEAALLGGETHYTSRPGIPELRRMIAGAIQSRGGPSLDEDPVDNVLITTGVSESLFVVLLGLGWQSGSLLVSSAEDCLHQTLLRLRGLSLTGVPGPNTCGVYRSSSLEPGEHRRLLDYSTKTDVPDLLDLGSDWPEKLPLSNPRRTLILGNLSRIKDLALFRVGYLMGPKDLLSRCRVWKQAFSICTAAPSQRAAVLQLREEGF